MWDNKGVWQLKASKILKDLGNKANGRENVRIQKISGRYKLGNCANTLTPKALTKGLSEKNGRGLPDRSVWTFEARAIRSME